MENKNEILTIYISGSKKAAARDKKQADSQEGYSLKLGESFITLKIDIKNFGFFVSSKLSSAYKSKLIRLLSLTVRKEMVLFSKSSIRTAQFKL